MRDVVLLLTSAVVVGGGLFALVAALGIVRLPDLLTRMHAQTKAGAMGAGLILTAAALQADQVGVALRAAATIVFLLITAPVAAHLIGRAGYWTGCRIWENTVIDEFSENEECPWIEPGERQAAEDETTRAETREG